MNTILSPSLKSSFKGRILAIEPDPMRARNLREILGAHVEGSVEVVASTEGAIRSIGRQLPDVVLTSSFLSPADEGKLTHHLKSLTEATHVQVIITPHFIDPAQTSTARSGLFGLRKQRPPEVRPGCAPGTFLEQIEDYVRQARTSAHLANRRELQEVLSAASADPIVPEMGLVKLTPADVNTIQQELMAPAKPSGRSSDRRRELRRQRQDLPWLWSTRLPWGTEVQLVDLSRRGVLLETAARMTLGSTLDLHFIGKNTDVNIPARVLRSDVATVDGFGVRYRVAAQFCRDFDLFQAEHDLTPDATPAGLATVLARVLGESDRRSPAVARARFEEELRYLLPVQSIEIREAPLEIYEGTSVYFNVQGSGSPVLQAVFNPDSPPSASDFTLLRVAAHLAAVVLEFAPLPEKQGLQFA